MKKPIRRLLTFVITCGCFAGCDPEALIAPAEVIRFSTTAVDTLPADNRQEIQLSAIITREAAANLRSVSFVTDLGTFTNGTKEVTVAANDSAVASVFLKSDAAGTATVKATIASISATTQVVFVNATVADAIRFVNLDTSELLANTQDTRAITVQVDPSVPVGQRSVTFTTDIGAFSNGAATVTLPSDDQGLVTTYLHADKTGTATVRAKILQTEIAAAIPVIDVDPDAIVRIVSISPVDPPADGATTVELQVQIDNRMAGAAREVMFRTLQGSFATGAVLKELAVTPNGQGIATALLSSSEASSIRFSVAHRGVLRDSAVTFVRALPEQARMELPFTLQAGIAHHTTVTTILSRLKGKPGMSFQLTYTAWDTTGTVRIGQFNSARPSDAQGVANVEFSAGNTAYRGKVRITATVTEAPAVMAEGEITVIDP